MSNGKTILEWLNELPEPYKTQAIDNLTNKTTSLFPSMEASLLAAFIWHETEQGTTYWGDLAFELSKDPIFFTQTTP